MSGELLSTGIDELEDILYVFSVDGDFLEWNEQLPEITGYDDEELGSMEPRELFSGDDREAVDEAIETAIDERRRSAVQAKLETKGGKEMVYELSAAPIERDGDLEAIVGIARDITDRLENERRLREMANEIRDLSMPVVEIWSGVILTTIVGSLDTQKAERLTEDLLQQIVEVEAAVALIDITGVSALDTATAQHLIDTINAVNLLGANVVITGISPDIAQTLVQLGVELNDIETQSSLMEGLRVALSWQGVDFN
ncbi:PAS domain S-box protein [Halorientalis brevis]|uniref:PAS domain S-box protein n=1 Tax=Halorientalis brevis TaxID=1126241 RepID=A0ABD6CD82_9EURY|nr:PAS domain S-box protein [Halorientalis brevis]